jgi:hypothetical protein
LYTDRFLLGKLSKECVNTVIISTWCNEVQVLVAFLRDINDA